MKKPESAQLLERQEAVFDDAISFASNSESKLATLLVLEANGGYMTGSQIRNDIMDAQGTEPGWEFSQSNVSGRDFCRHSFSRCGFTESTDLIGPSGRIAEAWRITPEGATIGKAMAGLLLDWSLKNPTIGLHGLFGSSNSTSDSRAPKERYTVFQSLLTHPHNQISLSDIGHDLGVNLPYVNDLIGRMESNSLVLQHQKGRYNQRQLEITRPEFEHTAYDLRDITPEYQTIYRTMEFLAENGLTHVTMEQFLAEAQSLQPDEADLRKARAILARAVTHAAIIPGLREVPGSIDYRSKNHGYVVLNPDVEESILALTNDLLELEYQDPATTKRGCDLADAIMKDSDKVAELYAIARTTSPNANSKDLSRWGEAILGVLPVDAGIGIDELQGRLKESGMKPTTITHLQKICGKLASSGVIGLEVLEQALTTKGKMTVSRAAE